MTANPQEYDNKKLTKLIQKGELADVITKNHNLLSKINYSSTPQRYENTSMSYTDRIKGKADI